MQIAKIISAIILIASSYFASAQPKATISVDSSITELITELRAQHIDTILIYKSYFVGSRYVVRNEIIETADGKAKVITNDDAYCKSEPTYIIWTTGGKTYLTKRDLCYNYSVKDIDAKNVWKTFFYNIETIKHEKAKMFSYLNEEGKIYFSSVDHTGIQNLIGIVKMDTFKIDFDSYQMSDSIETDHRIRVNLSYDYNQSLKGKKFIDELDALINSLNKNELLKQTWR